MPTEPNARPRGTDAARSARFEAQVVPYLDAAYNLAHWLTHNPADAQDVVQEAMLRALRYFDSFHGGDARVWLLAIVRNTFYTLRSRSPQDALHDELDDDAHPLIDQGPSPETLTLLAVDVGALQAAMERLPAPLREIDDLALLTPLDSCMRRIQEGRQTFR